MKEGYSSHNIYGGTEGDMVMSVFWDELPPREGPMQPSLHMANCLRFIKTHGTEIIVEMAVGCPMSCVKQNHSLTISSSDLELHLKDVGHSVISDGKNLSPIHCVTRPRMTTKSRLVQQTNNLRLSSYLESSIKDVSFLTLPCQLSLKFSAEIKTY